MRYEDGASGYSFELPAGWKKEEHIVPLTFACSNGVIQVQIGVPQPQYLQPATRERFLSDPGCTTVGSKCLGGEPNTVVIQNKSRNDGCISTVRDNVHYLISYTNASDPIVREAISHLLTSFRFPSQQRAAAAIESARQAGPAAQVLAKTVLAGSPQHVDVVPPLTGLGIVRCETCPQEMQVLGDAGLGGVTLSRDQIASGSGVAEQCWECGRVYCDQCYPARPRNTCVCGRGRDAVRHIGDTVYRGSLRLVEVRYLTERQNAAAKSEHGGELMRVSVPQLGRSYDLPATTLNPYTQAEMAKALPRLKGRSLFIDFQRDIDGPQTATRLIRETLGKVGVNWVGQTDQAEAVIWIQGGSTPMRFAFVVGDPHETGKFVGAECGPRELTATIMTAVSEYFTPTIGGAPRRELPKLIAHVNELNRAITGAAIAQDWPRACQLMADLRVAIEQLGSIGGKEAVKPVVDALADSAGAYENTGFAEARAVRETAIDALRRIGKDSIPWIKKGLTHSHPAVREACKRALKACGGKPWWQFW